MLRADIALVDTLDVNPEQNTAVPRTILAKSIGCDIQILLSHRQIRKVEHDMRQADALRCNIERAPAPSDYIVCGSEGKALDILICLVFGILQ
jgi:hypothetical protein